MSDRERLARFEMSAGRLRVVIDTDTYNEVDDQFALVYALFSPERIGLEAIYAAPFTNERAADPASGMSQSYEEILRLFALMKRSADGLAIRGSESYLDASLEPRPCPAVLDLIERAKSASPEQPLFVIGLAAATNIATAILLDPSIIRNIVVVWLGGHALYWPDTNEFNLRQDIPAARVLLDSGVPLVLVPCNGVARLLDITLADLERHVEPCGALGAYLTACIRGYSDDHLGWSKPLWDVAAIAHLVNRAWAPADLIHSPILTDDATWSNDSGRHLIHCVRFINRNRIIGDLFRKLRKDAGRE